jgi:hypothetical protein
MGNFKNVVRTDYFRQVGATLDLKHGESTVGLKAYVCTIEEPRLFVDVGEDRLLSMVVGVDGRAFVPPVVTYSDDKSYVYLTFSYISLEIKADDEGFVFDVWDKDCQEDGSLESTYLFLRRNE